MLPATHLTLHFCQLLLLPRDLLHLRLPPQLPLTPRRSLACVLSITPPATAAASPFAAQVDALFADLLADDPPLRPRPAGGIITAAFSSGAAAAAVRPPAPTGTGPSAAAHAASTLRHASLPSAMTGAGHKEVTITTAKDFAGQIVNVTRTVAVGSAEHQKLLQVQRHARRFRALCRHHTSPPPPFRSPRAQGWSRCWD